MWESYRKERTDHEQHLLQPQTSSRRFQCPIALIRVTESQSRAELPNNHNERTRAAALRHWHIAGPRGRLYKGPSGRDQEASVEQRRKTTAEV